MSIFKITYYLGHNTKEMHFSFAALVGYKNKHRKHKIKTCRKRIWFSPHTVKWFPVLLAPYSETRTTSIKTIKLLFHKAPIFEKQISPKCVSNQRLLMVPYSRLFPQKGCRSWRIWQYSQSELWIRRIQHFKWIRIWIQSGSRVVIKLRKKKIQQQFFLSFLIQNCNLTMSKLQEKPSAHKRFINFFYVCGSFLSF